VLYFAYRLIQFPLGIFSNALSQAILPELSVQALENVHDNLKRTLSFGLRAVFFVMLPASVGFIVLSRPIILGLFGGGRFDNYSAQMTANALLFYSIGLTAYGTTKILQSCFFALKDTLTPAKVSAISLIMNILLNLTLMFPMKLSGLALATSISGIITTFILFSILQKKLHAFNSKEILVSFVRILVASIAMGAICFGAASQNIIIGDRTFARLLQLGLLLVLGAVSYAAFCFIFRVREMQELWNWLRNRKQGRFSN